MRASRPRTVVKCILVGLSACGAFMRPAIAGDRLFRTYGAEQGLSQSTANAIVQDRKGFLWFGTQDGLNRFDAYEFTIFRHLLSDSLSLSDNYIWSLCEDTRGNLWVGTLGGGLNCLRADGSGFLRYSHDPASPQSISSNNVTALLADSDGIIWAGTWGGGLDRIDPDHGKVERFALQLHNGRTDSTANVRCLYRDHEGVLWLGTWQGLVSMNMRTGRWRLFTHDSLDPESISGDKIVFIREDRLGRIWIGTYDDGLNVLDDRRETFRHYRHISGNASSLASDRIVAGEFDALGKLWIGTVDRGLDVLDISSGVAEHLRHDPLNPGSIGSDRVFSMYRDGAGAMWVGTADAGICRADPRSSGFSLYRGGVGRPGSLSANNIRGFTEDAFGDLWIGTVGGGLDRYDRSRHMFIQYRHRDGDPHSLSSDYVFSVLEGSDGTIWIGTQNDGLDSYNRRTGRFTHYPSVVHTMKEPGGDAVMALYEDHTGTLWVGTTGSGIARFDRKHDAFYHVLPGDVSVWAIHEDHDGSLWLGTWGGGLVRIDRNGRILARYRHDPSNPNSLSNNTVWSIYEDASGDLWLGTWGGGLNRYRRATDDFMQVTVQQGLPNDVVYGILSDSRGNLWLSTNDGLCRFDPTGETFKTYSVMDGLQGDEFNQGAYLKGRDGTLYFGGVNGFNAIQPDSIRPNVNVPSVVLTNFKIFDRPILLRDGIGSSEPITLLYRDDFISFEFAALDYSAPERNRYAYMLEGFDHDWIYSGTRRYVAYTRLDGGHYVFRVKGSNSDGVWGEPSLSIQLTVTPPLWRTSWFIVLGVVIVVVIVLGLYRYRVTKLVEMERLRTHIASDLHDELASNLSSIALFASIVQEGAGDRADSTEQQMYSRIVSLAKESVTSIREIIWAIDTRPETIRDLLIRLKDTMLPVCHAKSIQLLFDDPEPHHFPGQNLAPEQRKDLWLLLKEAMTNAVQHSCCAHLAVDCAYERGRLRVSVVDDGRGLTGELAGKGKGFHTMRMRAKNLGGSVDFLGTEGGGTTVRIDVSL